LFDTLFRDTDFDLYYSDVDATLALKLAALTAKQQVWVAKKSSKTRTMELAHLSIERPPAALDGAGCGFRGRLSGQALGSGDVTLYWHALKESGHFDCY
jgi:hypothetical protein